MPMPRGGGSGGEGDDGAAAGRAAEEQPGTLTGRPAARSAAGVEGEGAVDNALDSASPTARWCSWCYAKTEHKLQTKKLMARNEYECLGCVKRTVGCSLPTCKAMARHHGHTGDKLCAVHDTSLDKWGTLPVTQPKRAHCGWCLRETLHILLERRFTARSVYQCTSCLERTLPCRTCTEAFARGHADSDADTLCLWCQDLLVEYSATPALLASNMERLHKRAWCSWCFEQRVEQTNVLGRHVYRCEACNSRTVPCTRCDGDAHGRTSTFWNDKCCARCDFLGSARVAEWNEMLARKTRVFAAWDESKMSDELVRDSDLRRKALRLGLIRPFLLLVTMPPQIRAQVATSLSMSYIPLPFFGDAHEEALYILTDNRRGVQTLANHSYESLNPLAASANWYDVLRRTSLEVFRAFESGPSLLTSESMAECRTSGHRLCADAEEEPLERYIEFQAHLEKSHSLACSRMTGFQTQVTGGEDDGVGDGSGGASAAAATSGSPAASPAAAAASVASPQRSTTALEDVSWEESDITNQRLRFDDGADEASGARVRTSSSAGTSATVIETPARLRTASDRTVDFTDLNAGRGPVAGEAGARLSHAAGYTFTDDSAEPVPLRTRADTEPVIRLRAMSVVESEKEHADQLALTMRRAGVRSSSLRTFYKKSVSQATGGFAGAALFSLRVAGALGATTVTTPAIAFLNPMMGPLAIIGWASLGAAFVRLTFGSNLSRVLPAIVPMLHQRMVLASMGIDIDHFFGAKHEPEADKEADDAQQQ